MRQDGRNPGDLRPVHITTGFIRSAPASLLIEVGNTRVICAASVEEQVPLFLRDTGRGWVTAEYGMLPASSPVRIARESARGRVGGRTHEIQRLIGRSLRAVIDLKKLGERTLHVDCDVLQADGGTRCASICGAWVAVADAVDTLLKSGALAETPITGSIAAVSVGVWQGQPVLDLDYVEDSGCDTDMNVVMTGSGGIVEVQGTAEGAPFTRATLEALLDLAAAGIAQISAAQQAALKAD